MQNEFDQVAVFGTAIGGAARNGRAEPRALICTNIPGVVPVHNTAEWRPRGRGPSSSPDSSASDPESMRLLSYHLRPAICINFASMTLYGEARRELEAAVARDSSSGDRFEKWAEPAHVFSSEV